MRNYRIIFFLSLVTFSCSKTENKDTLPNIVFILADDLGYGEIGILGQEKIETPNILDEKKSLKPLISKDYSYQYSKILGIITLPNFEGFFLSISNKSNIIVI